MRIMIPLSVPQYLIPELGIAIHSSETIPVECTVEKYWEDDTNPDSYKVKLVPVDEQLRPYLGKSMYSMDLKSSIERSPDVYSVIK